MQLPSKKPKVIATLHYFRVMKRNSVQITFYFLFLLDEDLILPTVPPLLASPFGLSALLGLASSSDNLRFGWEVVAASECMPPLSGDLERRGAGLGARRPQTLKVAVGYLMNSQLKNLC